MYTSNILYSAIIIYKEEEVQSAYTLSIQESKNNSKHTLFYYIFIELRIMISGLSSFEKGRKKHLKPKPII